MCQILKLPLLLSYFSLLYLIDVTEETGTFSFHRLFREIPKRLCFKERTWGANSLAKSERGKVAVSACPNSGRPSHCKHALLLVNTRWFSKHTCIFAPCSVLLISSCVMNDDYTRIWHNRFRNCSFQDNYF